MTWSCATVSGPLTNSVGYLRGGTTLGIGAGQQSRVDCTRLAAAKADTWRLRGHPAVRALTFRPGIRRQDRINGQIRFIEGGLTPDETQRRAQALSTPADELTAGQRAPMEASLTGFCFVSDGALPFRDNVDHAQRHGGRYIAEPGGSVRSARWRTPAASTGSPSPAPVSRCSTTDAAGSGEPAAGCPPKRPASGDRTPRRPGSSSAEDSGHALPGRRPRSFLSPTK